MNIEIDVVMKCMECGTVLDDDGYDDRRGICLVQPCPTCVEKAREEEREESNQ